jgi:4-hydroxybenzoyl-CoA reductase subunit alpha
MNEYSIVGQGLPRVDGMEKVTGAAKYAADITMPAMLCGKILLSPHPHARILHIDTSQAEKLPGVKAVITGRDVPKVSISFVDTPRYPGDQYALAVDKVRYIGDEVAAVAAVDEDTAEEAMSLIRVEYEPLPAVFNPEEAMKPEAPRIHDLGQEQASVWEEWGAKKTVTSKAQYTYNNLSGETHVGFGHVEGGFARADYVRQDRFETQATAHCAMEPHAAVANFDPSGKLNVWLSSMSIFYKRYMLARLLGQPASQVRVHKTYIGGAFGGKIDLFPYEVCAALLSQEAGRPVKIELTREEVFTTTRQRHPTIIEIKTGVKRDGTILAQEIQVIVDNGGYRGTGAVVIFLMHAFNLPIYHVPNLKYDGYAVYTNNPVRGPQRAHGAPQIRFAIDSQLDMIAQELGLDTVEVMLRNARHKGDVLPNGDRLHSCELSECIQQAAEASGWREKRSKPDTGRWRRGIGISACSMFSGAPFYPFASAAAVQGAETTMAQIVAEELGVSLSAVRVVSGDTELCPIDLGNFLSGGAFVTGNAVRAAAADARRQLFEVASDLLDAIPEELEMREGRVSVRGRPKWGMSLGEVVTASIQRRDGDPIMGRGHAKPMADVDRYPSLAKAKGRFTPAYGFAVTAAEVEVDTRTGEIRPVQIHTFHDCGFALNPKIVEGQIHGNVSMGQGQALWEEVILKEGQVMNPSFLDYKLPTAVEPSPIQGYEVSSLEPHGPFGAKEVGEGSIASVLAAIANAVHNAVGVRVTSLPITSEKVLSALERKKG